MIRLCFYHRMKTISIILSRAPSAQWEEWINALIHAGFKVKVVEPMGTMGSSYDVLPGDAVVLDGMLPHLGRFMAYLQRLFPGLPTIITSETVSFTIEHEAMHLDEAVYISGPLPPEQFVEAVDQVAARRQGAVA